jgi:aspartate dehydrogenase
MALGTQDSDVSAGQREGRQAQMLRVGLIGFGAIGSAISDIWDECLGNTAELAAVLVKPDAAHAAALRIESNSVVCADFGAFLEFRLRFVIEAAGHQALSLYGQSLLRRGCDLLVMSVGALSDDRLREDLRAAAEEGGSRLLIPAGALAGFDGLMSLRAAGLRSVTYFSAKPPIAWAGTAAEECCRLQDLAEYQVIFEGTARQAAMAFPQNANLAAAVALAGLGFDDTAVVLAVDPALTINASRLMAKTDCETLEVILNSGAFEQNPKTSRIAAISAISAIQSREARIGFR